MTVDIAAIGTLMIGIGSCIAATASLFNLRATRRMKVDVAHNTRLTQDVHDSVVEK